MNIGAEHIQYAYLENVFFSSENIVIAISFQLCSWSWLQHQVYGTENISMLMVVKEKNFEL